MNKKTLRYILGFVILFVIFSAIVISKLALFIVSIPFIIFSLKEYREMFSSKEISVHKFLPETIGILLSFLYIYNATEFVTPILVLGIILSFFLTIIKNRKPYMSSCFATIMGFIFIFCTLYIVKLFYFFSAHKFAFILVYFSAILLGDFGASKIGPLFKNKLLAPEISPNKTVAGAVSNMCLSCFACLGLHFIMEMPIIETIILGIVISLFSQIGDLSVSLIKRELGLKHSGTAFFDYGGILDRVDAFIFSAPAAYYCLFAFSII